MRRIHNLPDYFDFLATVIIHAPDRFPSEDFLPPEEQLNLERAFSELRDGMEFISQRITASSALSVLGQLLDDSLAAYRLGDAKKGARLLQDFEEIAFRPELASLDTAGRKR
jgi:hypothetical protein